LSENTSNSSRPGIVAEQPENSLAGWLRLQKSIALRSGMSLASLSRDGAVIGRIENDNSVCQALRVAGPYAQLCSGDCGTAFERADQAGSPVFYKCHAGLSCFATPISVGGKHIVVLGGRVFTSSADYTQFLQNYQKLDQVRTGECLQNVAFGSVRELNQTTAEVEASADSHFGSGSSPPLSVVDSNVSPGLLDAHLEIIRLTDQLESRKRAFDHLYDFLRGVASTLDGQRAYHMILTKFREILSAGRSSLMVLNEESGELCLEAALGSGPDAVGSVRLRLGDPVAGFVLSTGQPMLVKDVETDRRLRSPRPGRYRGNSFISFPITVGSRRVGVVNLTDRIDGTPFKDDDVAMLELMSPNLALIIDRTEWHKKAETYQRMSLTDPLTSLPNRRYLEDRLFEEVERSKRYGTPLSFMIIDVDHFKTFNDIHGHTNADRVLIRTGQILRSSIRAIDTSARFAGDEFCIVLPETELEAAAAIAERLRASVNRTEIRTEQSELIGNVTISVGVSSFSQSRQSPLAVIQAADRALYQAKTAGRNCVAVYGDV
jgi:diguanylate cyclase (GGDEF)-like protein